MFFALSESSDLQTQFVVLVVGLTACQAPKRGRPKKSTEKKRRQPQSKSRKKSKKDAGRKKEKERRGKTKTVAPDSLEAMAAAAQERNANPNVTKA